MSGFDGLIGAHSPLPRPRLLGDEQLPVADDGVARTTGGDFKDFLRHATRGLTELQQDAQEKSMALARGEPVQMHDVLVAMGKSDVAFNLAIEVRNKLLEAWEQLSRSVV